MGCGSSRAVTTVESTRPSSTKSRKKNQVVPNTDKLVPITRDSNHNIIHVSPSNSTTDVRHSAKRREISASSTRTADSGISELKEDIITENSNTNQLEKASERPSTPELVLEGQSCPRLQSGKEKRRLQLEKKNSESSIPTFPPLGDGSLLERPKTRGGIKFDILLCPETGNIKKAPTNLAKLERRKRRKKLTKEELEEKMRKATERREEHRQKIIEKSQAFLGHYGNSDQVRRPLSEHGENEELLENNQELKNKEQTIREESLEYVESDLQNTHRDLPCLRNRAITKIP